MTINKKSWKVWVILLIIGMTLMACSENNAQINNEPSVPENTVSENQVSIDLPSFSSEEMMTTIEWLAPHDNARITGFEGERLAGDYLIERFEALGLEVDTQEFPIDAYQLNGASVTIIEEQEKSVEAFKVLSYSGPGDQVVGELVPVGLGGPSDYMGLDVEGKIAFVERGRETFYDKTKRAAEKGALGIVIYDDISQDGIAGTLGQVSTIPAISLGSDLAKDLKEKLESGQNIQVSMTVVSMFQASTSRNIIGKYVSDNNPKGQYLILSAHYDGVDTPAANDNASGVAVVLELARVLIEGDLDLPFDVHFIGFGAEEVGLVGSNYYVNALSQDLQDQLLSVINFDMVGIGHTISIGLASQGDHDFIQDKTKTVFDDLDYPYEYLETDRSDHAPFSRVNIPAIMVMTTPFSAYHTDDDVPAIIEEETLLMVCDFALKLILEF